MKQYNKPRKSRALFNVGFLQTIPSSRRSLSNQSLDK